MSLNVHSLIGYSTVEYRVQWSVDIPTRRLIRVVDDYRMILDI